ncbi:MAG: sarcosine oxidase subunit gamma [Pseudomonadota bacterium]
MPDQIAPRNTESTQAITLQRSPALAGWRLANEHVMMEAAPPASRISLRAGETGANAFEASLGLKLPRAPHTSASRGSRHALWLGPDEWLVFDERNPETSMVPRLGSAHFAATDISHRNVAFITSGPRAKETLAVASPRDLRDPAFPVGACSRTIFGKAEIVLYRIGEDAYRIECWRSFGPYMKTLLTEAAKDAGL